METYHKIQTLFKRHLDGPKKGKLIVGDWARPEIGYLADLQWEFTEKVDGTNIRIELVRNGDILVANYGGRSDNAVIPKHLLERLEALFPTHPHWRRDLGMPAYTKRNKELLDWMESNGLDRVVLFGEGYGKKIQNGGNYMADRADFVLFDVKVGDFWLDRDNVNDVAKNLGIDSVPVIGYGTMQDAVDIVSTGITFNKQGGLVRWGSGGLKSQWGDFEAEGIVARPMQPLFNRKGERIIVKIKGVDFK